MLVATSHFSGPSLNPSKSLQDIAELWPQDKAVPIFSWPCAFTNNPLPTQTHPSYLPAQRGVCRDPVGHEGLKAHSLPVERQLGPSTPRAGTPSTLQPCLAPAPSKMHPMGCSSPKPASAKVWMGELAELCLSAKPPTPFPTTAWLRAHTTRGVLAPRCALAGQRTLGPPSSPPAHPVPICPAAGEKETPACPSCGGSCPVPPAQTLHRCLAPVPLQAALADKP